MADLRIDAKKFIEILVGECDPGTDDHAWRTCRRCLAIHEVQNYGTFAMRMLRQATAALSARAAERNLTVNEGGTHATDCRSTQGPPYRACDCRPARAAEPRCVCTVEDGLVQEWVSKAREVAKAKSFEVSARAAEGPQGCQPWPRGVPTTRSASRRIAANVPAIHGPRPPHRLIRSGRVSRVGVRAAALVGIVALRLCMMCRVRESCIAKSACGPSTSDGA